MSDGIVRGFSSSHKALLRKSGGRRLVDDLIDTDFFEWIGNKFGGDDYNAVVSMYVYPFDLRKLFGLENVAPNGNVYILGKRVVKTSTPDDAYSVNNISDQKCRFHAFTYVLDNMGENFYDYSPYTIAQIYLPLYGYLNLSVNEIMKSTLYIYYSIDFESGECVIEILRQSMDLYQSPIKIASVTTIAGIGIPLGRVDKNSIYDNIWSSGVQVAAGIATAAIGGASTSATNKAMSILDDSGARKALADEISKPYSMAQQGVDITSTLLGNVSRFNVNVTKGEYTGAFLATATEQADSSWILLLKPDVYEPSNYAHTVGKPLMQTKVLNTLTGYTVVEGCHLENIDNATVDELSAIQSALMSGVIL